MPVSCYICGRDFGTKSISIHIPNCIKKWEAEQKKLPKSQRRPPPAPPVNLDKVISGELKGEELYKFNGEVLQEWNDSALVPCENCSRTFLPSSLKSHQRSCTSDNPMTKNNKEQSYASRAGAKVSYPKLKSKEKESPKQLNDDIKTDSDKPITNHKVDTKTSDVQGEIPSCQDIIDLINSSSVLRTNGEVRTELFTVVKNFLKKHHE